VRCFNQLEIRVSNVLVWWFGGSVPGSAVQCTRDSRYKFIIITLACRKVFGLDRYALLRPVLGGTLPAKAAVAGEITVTQPKRPPGPRDPFTTCYPMTLLPITKSICMTLATAGTARYLPSQGRAAKC